VEVGESGGWIDRGKEIGKLRRSMKEESELVDMVEKALDWSVSYTLR